MPDTIQLRAGAGRILSVKLDRANHLTLAADEYFVLWDQGAAHLVPSRCLHRGGPLRLGRWSGAAVVCPWHGTSCSIRSLLRRQVPSIHRKDEGELIIFVSTRHGPYHATRWRTSWLDTPAETDA